MDRCKISSQCSQSTFPLESVFWREQMFQETSEYESLFQLTEAASFTLRFQDPNSAIPKGTILAIIITSISYAVVAIICGATMKRAGKITTVKQRWGTNALIPSQLPETWTICATALT